MKTRKAFEYHFLYPVAVHLDPSGYPGIQGSFFLRQATDYLQKVFPELSLELEKFGLSSDSGQFSLSKLIQPPAGLDL